MAHRTAAEIDSELDQIWLHIAKDSGSMEIADKVVTPSRNALRCWAGILESDAAVRI